MMQSNPAAAAVPPSLSSWLPEGWNLADWAGQIGNQFLASLILLVVSLAILGITRALAMPLLRRIIKKTRFTWDDVFLDADTFRWLSYIPPAVVFALGTSLLKSKALNQLELVHPAFLELLQGVAQGFIVLCVVRAFNTSLTAVNLIYSRRPESKGRPIKGFLQLAKISFTVIGSICAVALIFGQTPWVFLQYSAGLTAVMMFVFKDTILSLVASIQLTTNDMVQVGDWIEVPSCGADGDVIDVALYTVKVQNFDKTIVTVPTLKLVGDAFKNWRGMEDSGGRRIKREIHIDLSTIRFLDSKDIEKFGEIELIKDYIADKSKALASTNESRAKGSPTNSRRLTNIGTFRAYVIAYLKSLPQISGRFTFLVRQLQPADTGLPIQIYIFTKTTVWVDYEEIQSDLLEHLLAVLPEFGLRAFQQPSSHDVANLQGR